MPCVQGVVTAYKIVLQSQINAVETLSAYRVCTGRIHTHIFVQVEGLRILFVGYCTHDSGTEPTHENTVRVNHSRVHSIASHLNAY